MWESLGSFFGYFSLGWMSQDKLSRKKTVLSKIRYAPNDEKCTCGKLKRKKGNKKNINFFIETNSNKGIQEDNE